MTIMYTQILNLPNYKIDACSFSLHGESLSSNNKILSELRNVIQGIPDKSLPKIYDYNCSDDNHTFYLKISNDKAYSIITDRHTSNELATKFLGVVEEQYNDTDNIVIEPILKKEADRYNAQNDYLEADLELSKTRNVCIESLNKIVQRGEMIDKLGDLADKLREASHGLSRRSRSMYYNDLMT
ncbi:Vesicle-associated membrane protein, partial [Conglomerata obtusa]